jgi:hypothetical protein
MSAWLHHGNFAAGMVQDIPRHMLPENAVWDALDCFIGEEGTLHKRGSTVTALSSGTTLSGTCVGFSQLDHDDAALVRGYVVDESNGSTGSFIIGSFTPGSGTFATTSLSITQPIVSSNGVGRPFNHNGYLVVPVRLPSAASTNLNRMFVAMSGGQSAFQQLSTASVTVTQGSRQITGFSASDTNVAEVGDIIEIDKNAASDHYIGRITKISGSTISVTPTPTRSFTSGTGRGLLLAACRFLDLVGTGTTSFRGAQCGASWQNRVLFGGVGTEIAAGVYEWHPNRVIWSLLPTETSAVGGVTDGDLWLSDRGFPVSNYADVPWMDLVRGLEPVSDGEMLILGRPLCSRLVGTLNTNTTTSGGLTYELRPLNQKIQCVNDKATVRTPSGVMMMGPDGVYLYHNGNLINTMIGRIQNYFLDNIANSTIYGSGMIQSNHYYLSTSAGVFVCNMDGFRWTRFQNVDITNCFKDPQDTTRIFAARFQPGTASNTTKIVRVDYLANPGSSATTDVAGTGPTMTVKTKTYDNDEPSRLKQFRHERVTVRMPGSTGTVTVSSTPGLDGEESGATLGTITNAAGSQSKRYDTTTLSRAMGLTIAQTQNPDECELIDVDIAARALRVERVS